MCTVRASGTFCQLSNTTSAIIFHPTMLLVLDLHESRLQVTGLPTRCSGIAVTFSIRYRYFVAACHYVLWREFYVWTVSWLCQDRLAGKLVIVQLSSGFGFTRISSRAPCALASFSRARMPCSACTRDVTCELYCRLSPINCTWLYVPRA